MSINKAEIRSRMQRLEDCKIHLKSEFIGIDDIINQLMEYIQVWYLMPELLTRPVIVNLWGMTGVGKTDLVRKMVKFLDYQEKFTEIELSNSDEASYDRSVAEILAKNDITGKEPAIVLFDEIQRFNTLDVNGVPVPQTKFTDFWELLSDGRLSRKTKNEMEDTLLNLLFRKKDNDRRKLKNPDEDNDYPLLGYWEARELKKHLGLDEDMDDLAEMNDAKIAELIINSRKKKKIYEPIDYSKLLIIISGNLDEAYTMAGQTSESDVDADIFSAFTRKITFVDIKNALSRKFRPEQVARFGNIHLIYTSLHKEDFQKLIRQEINKRISDIAEKYSITLSVSHNIDELIYRNGVFPVQGVRPVFSSITDILDAHLSKFLFEALMNEETKIEIDFSETEKAIVATIGKKAAKVPFTGRIDRIRQGNREDAVANISVHECGHAVVYMLLTGLVPLQLKSKIASSHAGGFTFPHQVHETKQSLLNKAKIFLAGGLAEEVIFGKSLASTGRSSDRDSATTIILDYLRAYGFDEHFQATYNLELYPHRMNHNVTDQHAEELMKKLADETRTLLEEKRELLLDLSKQLTEKGSMVPREILQTIENYGLKAEIKEEAYLYIDPYSDILKGLV